LTLYWRAIDPSDQPLTVFTHILTGDGRLVAQHDASPAWGHRPTTGWVPGEYIIDKHTLQWTESDESYTGDAMLEVGLYNPVTGERLLNHQGEGQLLLPSVLVVR